MKGECAEMAGITSIGAYIPMYRLSLQEIAGFWRAKGASGAKAVAGYDEDSITMAVAAALDCLNGAEERPEGLYFATTTSPYREKQGAAVIASAIDLKKECITADFTNSLRAGTIAMRSAADAVRCGSAKCVLIAASDCRLGGPQGRNEQLLGDGAAAVVIGSDQTIADIEACFSLFSDFTDYWRNTGDTFVQSAEGRFIDVNGYAPTMLETIHAGEVCCTADFYFEVTDARAWTCAKALRKFNQIRYLCKSIPALLWFS
jgi:3-hydroxy-3-methylglutaryl CoA synthase